jgi:general secretion pathway protein D
MRPKTLTRAIATAALGLAVVSAQPASAAPDQAAACRKLPAGRRIVKLNLKPETEIGDLVAWISSITCKAFVLPGTIAASSKKVTIFSPEPITVDEAYRLFLSALDSVGLTVYPADGHLRIIESAKAKTSPIPFYVEAAPPNS